MVVFADVGNERSEAKGVAATEKSPSFRQKQKAPKGAFCFCDGDSNKEGAKRKKTT